MTDSIAAQQAWEAFQEELDQATTTIRSRFEDLRLLGLLDASGGALKHLPGRHDQKRHDPHKLRVRRHETPIGYERIQPGSYDMIAESDTLRDALLEAMQDGGVGGPWRSAKDELESRGYRFIRQGGKVYAVNVDPNRERVLAADYKAFRSDSERESWLAAESDINPDLTNEESFALYDYKNMGFVDVNDALRSGNTAGHEDAIRAIDSAISKTSLPENVIAHRATDGDFLGDDNLTGGRISDRSFVSVTLDKQYARELYPSGVIMEIRLPKGIKAISMDGIVPSADVKESELMLQRDISFEVISDTGHGSGRELVLEALVD